ncbi:MAG: cysteine-rich CWC family protein [Ottowia sp.]|uniref:cysteine-rich CWC family protein n=1 Tax=unclassified Ottowia TaxID=2645081 RepID=UPI003C2D3631
MSSEALNPSHCPLCGAPNACAVEIERATGQPQGPCWCMQASISFPQALLDRVPGPARGLACICRACAEAAEKAAPHP